MSYALKITAEQQASHDRSTKLRWRDARDALKRSMANPDDTAQVIRFVSAIAGKSPDYMMRRFIATPHGGEILERERSLLDVLLDRERLHALPEGTLGRTYAEWTEREQISAAGLKDPTGRKLDADYLNGRWTLVHVLNGPCGQSCIDALAHTRQVQQALGDDMNRVQRLMVVATPRYAENVAKPPELALAVAKSHWLASFSFAEDGSSQPFGIYLVDPQGYLMMRYPPNIDQRGLISDIERLLKISKIG